MTAAELAAYIGAAAWLPQIATWVYRAFVRPVIRIVPDRYAEVGFTNFGPILNLRMAFGCDRKDAIIDGFELKLEHSDGETRSFRWAGLQETFSEIRDKTGPIQEIVRDQVPIAMKIGTESLVEKFVRFQEPRFHEVDRPAVGDLLTHVNYLRRTIGHPEYYEKIFQSKELDALVDVRQRSFWWRTGQYTATLELSSPRKFSLTNPTFAFELTDSNIDHLRENLETVKIEVHNIVRIGDASYQPAPVNWNWANVNIERS